mmetsp:Transcript_17683/g.19832  ORF Transcript_17683/g.19832 Transcript_17683/m.19832 type:complete len:111 (+) Transcript_17683:701-1033(+)
MQLQRLERRRNHYIVSEETQLFVGLCGATQYSKVLWIGANIWCAGKHPRCCEFSRGYCGGGADMMSTVTNLMSLDVNKSMIKSEWDVIAFVNYMNAKKRRRTSIEGAYFL